MKKISENIINKIYQHANSCYPEECCGFIFFDGTVYKANNILNELNKKYPKIYTRTARNGYSFSVKDNRILTKSFTTNNPVTIIYHSHPDQGSYFSKEDMEKALFNGNLIHPVAYSVFVKIVVTVFCLKQLVASLSLFQGSA